MNLTSVKLHHFLLSFSIAEKVAESHYQWHVCCSADLRKLIAEQPQHILHKPRWKNIRFWIKIVKSALCRYILLCYC